MSVLVPLERFEHHQQNRDESGKIRDPFQPGGASAAQSVRVRQSITLRLLQQRKLLLDAGGKQASKDDQNDKEEYNRDHIPHFSEQRGFQEAKRNPRKKQQYASEFR